MTHPYLQEKIDIGLIDLIQIISNQFPDDYDNKDEFITECTRQYLEYCNKLPEVEEPIDKIGIQNAIYLCQSNILHKIVGSYLSAVEMIRCMSNGNCRQPSEN